MTSCANIFIYFISNVFSATLSLLLAADSSSISPNVVVVCLFVVCL